MTNAQPPSLAQVIDLALEKQKATSYRELDRISKDLGVHISHTTLSAMHAGRYRSELSRDTRERLARLAGVSVSELDGLSGLTFGEPFELPDSASELTADQRDAVLGVVRAFVNANKKGAGRGTAAATRSPRSNVRELRGKQQSDVPPFTAEGAAAKRTRPRPKNTDVTSE